MNKTSSERRKQNFVLTEIEKLNGSYPGVVAIAYGWFEQGKPAAELPAAIERFFGISITVDMASKFRTIRWVPHKEMVALKMATTKAAIESFGGDAGFDALLLAKLWEMMDEMTIPQLLSARTLFLKVRAQNLKEQEFLYKTGQLKPAPAGGGEVPDPQTQQRNVLRRIKEIFGLATDEEAESPAPQLPAAAGIESA